MQIANLNQLTPFTTADGSTIRALAGLAWAPARSHHDTEMTGR
jgi:hypothetical protein